MGKTLGSARHKFLVELIVEKRDALHMSQGELPKNSGSISRLSHDLKEVSAGLT